MSLVVATAIVVLLWPITRAVLAGFVGGLRNLRIWRTFALPVAVFAILVSAVVVSSGATNFLKNTVSGQDPSTAEHAAELRNLLPNVTIEPAGGASAREASQAGSFGTGLGTAGAKSNRFGEVIASGFVNSEIWYVDYVLQTGYFGLAALFLLIAVVARGLWQRRRNSMSRAALAIGAGLLVGAFFIPVLDEPALAIPLWTLIGLGLTYPRSGSGAGAAGTSHAAVEGAATIGGAGA